jgi:hypothetical protein
LTQYDVFNFFGAKVEVCVIMALGSSINSAVLPVFSEISLTGLMFNPASSNSFKRDFNNSKTFAPAKILVI